MSTAFLRPGYTPPMPALRVRLNRLGGAAGTASMEAIVDTGADMTIAPEWMLEQLGAIKAIETALVTQWGERHPVTLYLVDIEINGLRLPGVYIAGDENAADVILGRNVLNKLPLFLDGPEEQAEVLDKTAAKRLRARRG